MDNSTILDVESLSVHFGALKAVDDVSFKVKQGELLGLIGPNGAGKTTILNLITGTIKKIPRHGPLSRERHQQYHAG